MTRPTWLSRTVLATLLLPCWPLLLIAQEPGDIPGRTDDPARNRRWAQERFATAHAGTRQAARVNLETAQRGLAVAMQRTMAGQPGIALEDLSMWTQQILECEQLLQGQKVPLPALMRHWLQMLRSEELTESMFESGRVDTSSLAQARYQRLEVQLPLARALARGEPLPPAGGDFLPDQRWAKRRFAESSNEPNRVLLEMIETAKDLFKARHQNFLAGHGHLTLDCVQEAYALLLRAEQTMQPGNEANRTHLEGQLLTCHALYLISAAQYQAGRIDTNGLHGALYQKLAAVESLLPRQEPRPAFRPRLFQFELAALGGSVREPGDSRWVLQETAAANLTLVKALREQKRLVAQEGFRFALKSFLRGTRGSDQHLRFWDVRHLESSLLLQNEKGNPQLVALHLYRHAHEMEQETEARFQAGLVDSYSLFAARCSTLNAAIRYLQATNPDPKTKP